MASQPVTAVAAAYRLHRNVEFAKVFNVTANRALIDGQSPGKIGNRMSATTLQQFQEREHPRRWPHHVTNGSPDTGRISPGIRATVLTMRTNNTIRLASVRVITDDLPRTVQFYEVLTGATPNYLTEDFVELVTPSATLAVSAASRVPLITDGTPSGSPNNSSIVEFWVDDAEALLAALQATCGNDLDVVQAPTMMAWGNVSVLIRDPNGVLINLYTPMTPHAWQLQHNRTPKPEIPPPSS